MARVCAVCSKRTVSWNNRSHSMRATKRQYKPNIINKKVDLWDWIFVRVKICSRCYKKLVKEWKI